MASEVSPASNSKCPSPVVSSAGSARGRRDARERAENCPGVPLSWKEVQQLKRTIPVDDYEIGDVELVRDRLRKALKGEDERGRRQHWSYDQNRHMALMKFLRKYEGMRDDQSR